MLTPKDTEVASSDNQNTLNSIKRKLPWNPYSRMHPSKKSAAILVQADKEKPGTFICTQYEMGDSGLYRPVELTDAPKTPPKKPAFVLKDESKTPTPGITEIFAKTPKGTRMVSYRSVAIKTNDGEGTVCFLSPEKRGNEGDELRAHLVDASELPCENGEIEQLWGETLMDASKENLENNATGAEEEAETSFTLYGLNHKKRGGPRYQSQKQVMGKSAKEIFLDYIEEQYKDKLEPERFQRLKKLVSSLKLELLHALAHKLAPKGFNPQTKENLGAGTAWMNTLMMTMEALAEHCAKHYPGAVCVEPWFEMLGDSEIIRTVHYTVLVKKEDKEVKISSCMNALELPNRSNWPSTTDSPQLIAIAEAQLQGIKPMLQDRFSCESPGKPKMPLVAARSLGFQTFNISVLIPWRETQRAVPRGIG